MLLAPKTTLTLLFISIFSTLSFSQYNKKNNCSDETAFCDGFKTFENGDNYDGELTYGVPHGKGLMKFNGGDEYLGEFFKGKMHGKGAIILSNGDSYRGDWKEGQADGEGTYIKKDGSKFSGKFIGGKRKGEGKIEFKNGDQFKGNWKEDKLNGKAIFEFANGDKLETFWKSGRMKVKSTYLKESGKAIRGSLNNIFLEIEATEDFEEAKEVAMSNLQTVWISAAMEFKADQNYDLATTFLMSAQKYGPTSAEQNTRIAQELQSINTQKNSGWAQLPKK